MFKGGDYNAFVGDNGNYPERHDVMIVGNHHARGVDVISSPYAPVGSHCIFIQQYRLRQ